MIVPFVDIQQREQQFLTQSSSTQKVYFLLMEGQSVLSVYVVLETIEFLDNDENYPSDIGLDELKKYQLHHPNEVKELKPCEIKHQILWGEMAVNMVTGVSIDETVVECNATITTLHHFSQWDSLNITSHMKDACSLKTGFINSNDRFIDLSDVFVEYHIDDILILLNQREKLFVGCENKNHAIRNLNFELHF